MALEWHRLLPFMSVVFFIGLLGHIYFFWSACPAVPVFASYVGVLLPLKGPSAVVSYYYMYINHRTGFPLYFAYVVTIKHAA